jgi:MHS family proline/betaine transporter-like MFS transporter
MSGTQRKAIVAGIAGNVMEWYDFTVYGYFAAVIGANFFPAGDRVSSLIAAFGVFAAGYLVRPVGGLVFGHVGDRFGRKTALVVSVLAMALPTFFIGLLPTYRQIGIAAPILLTLCRLVQGLSVGGEYTTSLIFLVENAPSGRRGLLGSWGPVGCAGGLLLGSAVGAVLTSWLDLATIADWGWRVPFLLGIGVGLAGFQVRRHMRESDAPETPRARAPVREAFATEWRTIARITGLALVSGVGWYLCFVYVTTWLRQTEHLAASTAFDINVIAVVLLMVLMPAAGALSDRVGRKPVLLGAMAGLLALGWPLFWLMHHPSPAPALLGQCAFAILIAAIAGAQPAAMVEALPRRVRCSALSFGFGTAMAAFGGTAPLIAIAMIQHTQDDLSPAFYLMAAAAISLLVALGLRETASAPLR